MQNIKNKIIETFKSTFTGSEILTISILATLSLIGVIFYSREFLAEKFLTDRILYTGTITEGVVGSINNLNPLTPESQIEKDLSKLLFSGLVAEVNGKYEIDIAEKIDISNDGLVYKVYIRKDATFHDDSDITVKDIIFSISNLKDQNSFEGVEIGEIDSKTINFTLKSPFSKFLNKLNFPVIPLDYNPIFSENTIGSGPMKLSKVSKNGDNSISQINLIRFNNKKPKLTYLQKLNIKLYKNSFDLIYAYSKKQIDFTSSLRNKDLVSLGIKTNSFYATSSMPTNFVIFINQSKNDSLKDLNFRKLISENINRTEMIKTVFGGLAEPVYKLDNNQVEVDMQKDNPLNTLDKLKKSGFLFEDGVLYKSTKKSEDKSVIKKESKEEINLNLSVVDTEEMIESAKLVQSDLAKLGIKINLKIVNKSDLAQILKERNFDLFLFGFNIKDKNDFFSFFHSSQTAYPKLNISNFANKEVDTILEKLNDDKIVSEIDIKDLISDLSKNINLETPLIFLYKPMFAISKNRQNIEIILSESTLSSENRYDNLVNWYTDTQKVIRFFANNSFINKIELFF